MFALLESKDQITKAQRTLEATVRSELQKRIVKNIGYPGGTTAGARVTTDHEYWFWSADHKGAHIPNPRRLNWFGLFQKDADLQITVEVNTTYAGRNDELAGFFARNTDTGAVYLLHSGRLGGGTAGVGKKNFLTWLNQLPVQAADSSGRVREGLIVMPVSGLGATRSAIRYIDEIASFKQAARAHAIDTPEFRLRQEQWRDYYAESRGRRRGLRPREIDYLSRHGDTIDALHSWRCSQPLPAGGRVVKNVLFDMAIVVDDKLVEIFEAKSSAARSAIYGAIGQLMVHGTGVPCRRVLLLPAKERLAPDLNAAIERLRVELLRFQLDAETATIL